MATPLKNKEALIQAIKDYEGYALRISYGRGSLFLDKCDAIKKVASRAISYINGFTNKPIPRNKNTFFLESMFGNVPMWTKVPHETEFWIQVNKELGL